MLEAISVFFILVMASLGWGALAMHALERIAMSGRVQPSSLGELGLLGLLTLTVLAMILGFLLPLGGGVASLVVGAGFGATVAFRRRLTEALGPKTLLSGTLLGVLIVALPGFVAAAPVSADVGLYHLQFVKWTHEQPVVFGLANLYGRFGYNSAWLSTLAVFWLPGIGLKGVFLAGALSAGFILHAFASTVFAASSWREFPRSTAFAALSIPVLLSQVYVFLLPSITSTDQLPALLTIYCAFAFVRLADRLGAAGEDQHEGVRRDVLIIWLFVVFAIVAKISALPLVLLPLGVLVLRLGGLLPPLPLVRLLVIGLVIGGLWGGRNVALSGCLVYPRPETCQEALPWGVPKAKARKEMDYIKGWARMPMRSAEIRQESLETLAWIKPWLRDPYRGRSRKMRALLVALAVAMTVALLARFVASIRPPGSSQPRHGKIVEDRSGTKRTRFVLFWLTAATMAGSAFWFYNAPNLRFGWGNLLVLILLLGTYISWPVFKVPSFRKRILWGLAVAYVFVASASLAVSLSRKTRGWETVARQSTPPVQLRRIADGTMVAMPQRGDRCWLTPLPCTPELNPNLVFENLGHYLVIRDGSGE